MDQPVVKERAIRVFGLDLTNQLFVGFLTGMAGILLYCLILTVETPSAQGAWPVLAFLIAFLGRGAVWTATNRVKIYRDGFQRRTKRYSWS
jgi:hypothetical protein